MRVLVTGAAGFVGSHLCRALRDAGHSVVGLVSTLPNEEKRDKTIDYAVGDVRNLDSLSPNSFAGCEAVFHLVGIITQNHSKGQTFEAIHVRGTANVVRAATRAGVRHFVYLSAQGASATSASEYARTKAMAERIVGQAEISSTIFRPSIILGPNCAFAKQIEQLIRRPPLCPVPLPFIPIPGSGKNLFQPVWINDLIECLAQIVGVSAPDANVADNGTTSPESDSATTSEAPLPVLTGGTIPELPSQAQVRDTNNPPHNKSEIFEIGGAETVSFNDLLTDFAERIGKVKPLFHAPMPLMFAAAGLLEALLPRPPITVDQLLQLRVDNVCDNREVSAAFGITPIGFAEILSRMYGAKD